MLDCLKEIDFDLGECFEFIEGSLLLESKIQPDTAYQKQQVILDWVKFDVTEWMM